MILCKSCNFENPDGVEFCDQCHAPLHADQQEQVSGNANQPIKSFVGQVIGMRYIITADAIDYSFGDVFDAEDASDDSAVSLSVLPEDVAADQAAVDELKAAAGKVAGITHENLLGLLDVELEADCKFIVHEKFDAKPLSSKIASTPLSVEECLGIFTRVGQALDYVHSLDVIHGDIDPANILLDENDAVKLVFPALCRIIRDAAKDTNPDIRRFRSPEQFAGDIVRRSDIYSFAASIYYSLGGYQENGGFMSLGILSEAQNKALRNAMGSDPLCRQSTCAELLKDLGVDITLLQWKTVPLFNVSISGGDLGQVFLPTRPNAKFDAGTEIVIKAVPNDHYHFVSWTGSAVRAGKVIDENSAVTELIVDADYTLIANFQIDQHEFVVTSSEGGAVMSPAGDGGKYEYGSQVDLNAQPEENLHFVNWTGTAVENGFVAEPDNPVTTVTIEDDCQVHAEFAIDTFVLSVTCLQGGIVRTDEADISAEMPSDSEYVFGSEVAVAAEAEENYTFVEWTGSAVDAGKIADPTSAQTALTIDGEYSLNAVFVVNTHELNLLVSGSGMVLEPAESEREFDHGCEIRLRAVADEHSHFAGWIGSAVDSGKVADPSNSLTKLKVDDDYSLEAVFEVDRFAFEMSASEGGEALVEGIDDGVAGYEYGSTVTIVAKAKDNYHFVEWAGPAVDAGNVEDSTLSTTTVKVEGDYALCAVFELDVHGLKISSTDGGAVIEPSEGVNAILHDTEVVVKAQADNNYHFVEWKGSAVDNGMVEDITNPVASVVVDECCCLEAVFAINHYSLTLESSEGGSIQTVDTEESDYEHGTQVAVAAAADENYHFVEWAGSAVDARKVKAPFSKQTTVTVEADYVLHAVFALDRHVLNLSSVGGGSVTQPGEGYSEYEHGKQVVIKAQPDGNHHFFQWSVTQADEGRVADRFSAETTVTIDGDVSLEAVFEIDQHALKLSSSGKGTAGTIDDFLESYIHGREISIAALPDINHHFVEWTGPAVENGWVADPKSPKTTVTAEGEMQVEAVFAIDQKTLGVSCDEGGQITLPGWGQFSYSYGEQIVIECEADEKYNFVGWTGSAVDNGKVEDPASPKTTVLLEGEYDVKAVFEKENFIIKGLDFIKSFLKEPKGKVVAALLVVLLLMMIFDGPSGDNDSLSSSWEVAKARAQAGEFASAIAYADDIKERSEAFAKDQDIDGSIANWKKEIEAKDAWLEVQKYVDQSQFEVAIAKARILIKDYPETIAAEKARKEIEVLDEIRKIDEQISKAEGMKDAQDALALIDSALEDAPDNARETLQARAAIVKVKIVEKIRSQKELNKRRHLNNVTDREKEGNWAKAIMKYSRALEIYSDDEDIKDKLINAYVMQAGVAEKGKNYQKAIELYSQALSFKDPEDLDDERTKEINEKLTSAKYSLELLRNKEKTKAREEARARAQDDLKTEPLKKLSEIAESALNNNDYPLSIRICKKIKRDYPDFTEIEKTLVKAMTLKHKLSLDSAEKLQRAGRVEEALVYYREALSPGKEYLPEKTVERTQKQHDNLVMAKKKMDDAANKRIEIVNSLQDAEEAEKKGKAAEAFKAYEKAATAGSLEAMLAVGKALYDGAGVKEDCEKAVEWFKKAAEAGYVPVYSRLGLAYAEGKGKIRNLQMAFECFKKGANSGCSRSMYYLSKAYHNGEGIERDLDMAREWLVKSANAGDVWAMHNLAMLYQKGSGVKKDPKEALGWYKKAAQAGEVDAMYNLGVLYIKGDGVDKNETEGMWWLTRSAEKGNVAAKLHLGLAYLDGIGVAVNYQAAEKWLARAAEDGNLDAMDRLGEMYLKGLNGDKVPDKALKSYTTAAKGGHTGSMHKLGVMFFDGTDIKQDYKKAVKWFSEAARAGNSDSMYYLGLIFSKGLSVDVDKEMSVEWLTMAAKAGNVNSMCLLAIALRQGEGVSQDDAKAFEWFGKAAKAGSSQAAYEIGVMYEKAAGVEQDTYESVRWYQKSARLGNEKAKQRLVEMNEIW